MAKRKVRSCVVQVVERCEQCGAKFSVSMQRQMNSAVFAKDRGVFVVFRGDPPNKLPYYYCSEECIRNHAESIPN